MVKQIAGFIMLFGALSLIVFLGFSLYRANHQAIAEPKARFFMPNDLFIHLTLLINYWVMLVLMLEASLLSEPSTMMIIAALFAPFLNWWHKKRMGEL